MNDLVDVSEVDARMQFLLEQAGNAVAVIDQDDRVIGWNERAERWLGWKKTDVLGQPLSCLEINGTPGTNLRQGLLQFLAPSNGRQRCSAATAFAQSRTGECFPVELIVAEIGVPNVGPTLCIHIRDQAHWHAEVREQREAKEHFRSLLESTAEAIYEVNLNGICTYCNPACVRMLGYDSPGELIGRAIPVVIRELRSDGSLLPFSESRIYQAMQAGEGTHVQEDTFWTKTGAPLPVEYWSYPIRREEEIVGAIVTFIDISDRKEDALYRAQLVSLVESSYDAIIGRDTQGRITSWNTGAQRVYGYAEDEVLDQTVHMLLPPDMTQEEPEIRRAIQTGARLEQFETIRKRKDGRLIFVSLTISPITNEQGRIIGSSSIARDFTERKRNEEELRQAKEAAEQATRTRGEFLANVSHELRTPMNAIIGMTQLALGEELSDELRDFIATANDSAHSLLTLLNDILDFSKLESGKFTIETVPFNLRETIDDTVKALSVRAFEKKLELACEIGERVPTYLLGDSTRLRQVLNNLISNAIKFTEAGEVVVRVEAVRIWRTETVLLFSVTDTGVGILPEDQGRILEPFTQVDASTTRNFGGTGLGLAICNELLRLMGSRLTVHSTPGKGSRFSFRISFALQNENEGAPALPTPLRKLKKMRVLLVDDNESNLRILSKALASWSLVPETVRSGSEALAAIAKAQEEDRPFPLIIVDALMPKMDGYEFAQSLQGLLAAPPPVVLMVSSSDRREFKQRAAASGVSVCLQKPVSQSDLMDAIMRALKVEVLDTEPEVATPRAISEVSALSVLLAEDTQANQKVVTGILRKRGHHVTIARDGLEAFELFQQGDFDVILMDVQMPVMDGLQATMRIRQYEKQHGGSIPIVAMTAHAMRGDREKCLQAGMDAYLAKPIDVTELLELVESVGQGPNHDWRQNFDEKSRVAGDRAVTGEVAPNVIDIHATMERLGGDEDLLQSFIGFYDEDAPVLWKTIERSAEAGDLEALQRAAHSLKGLAANFSAVVCVDKAHEIEMQARAQNLPACQQNLPDLKVELDRLGEALSEYRT